MMTSEKLTATIKARAMKFALDNGFTHHVLLIEDAMLIGASIGLESQLESPAVDPECECPGCGCIHAPAESCPDSEPSDGMTDVEADADTLRSAGWGTDEDYGGGDDRL
jgi:hypothetical protein